MKVPTLKEFNTRRMKEWQQRQEKGMPDWSGVLCPECLDEGETEQELIYVSNKETDGRNPESMRVRCPSRECSFTGWKLI